MDEQQIKRIIEALLMSSEKALSLEQIESVFDEWQKPERPLLRDLINELAADYAASALELIQTASGYHFQTRQQYSEWINRLNAEKPARYTRALLETLAIIAYRQPVSRADIEEIRGVAVSTPILKTLLERDWIRIAGHRDVPGKPAVYATTKAFLDYFSLKSIEQLPDLPVIEGELPAVLEQATDECVTNE